MYMTREQIERMGREIYGARWPYMRTKCPQLKGCPTLGWEWSDITGALTKAGSSALDIYGKAKSQETTQALAEKLISAQSSGLGNIATIALVAGAGLLAFKLLAS